jgi:hypothetical protein
MLPAERTPLLWRVSWKEPSRCWDGADRTPQWASWETLASTKGEVLVWLLLQRPYLAAILDEIRVELSHAAR